MVPVRPNARVWRTHLARGGLVLSLLLAVTAAHSQPPSASGGNTQGEHQPSTDQDRSEGPTAQNMRKPPPTFIGGRTTDKPKIAAQPQEQREWYADPNWWVAGFTGALFLATSGLWGVTGLMWCATRRVLIDNRRVLKVSLRHAQAAEDAVKATQDIVNTERAWIVYDGLVFNEVSGTTPSGEKIENAIRLHAGWRNFGRSPAVGIQIFVDHKILPFDSIDIPTFTPKWFNSGKANAVLGQQQFTQSNGRLFRSNEITLLLDRKIKIFFYSSIKYEDVILSNIQHISEVCLEVSFMGFGTNKSTGKSAILWDGIPVGPQNAVS